MERNISSHDGRAIRSARPGYGDETIASQRFNAGALGFTIGKFDVAQYGRFAGLAAEQQAFENDAFRAWWSSDTGLELRRIVDRVQSVSSLLGKRSEYADTLKSGGAAALVKKLNKSAEDLLA